MKIEDALYFLENEEKRNDLIYKLKSEGEDSEASKALKQMIQSLNADKPSKYVNQTNILQHTFRFLNPSDAFSSFRIVSKSWKRAVDAMRFNRSMTLTTHRLLSTVQTRNKQRIIPSSFRQFACLHKGLILYFPSLEESVFHRFSLVIEKLNYIRINYFHDVLPINFTSFCFKLFHNSQNTLTYLEFNMKQIPTLPEIHLPNLEYCSLALKEEHDSQIEEFSKFVKTILQNTDNALKFYVSNIIKTPQIMNYILTTYPQNCLFSNSHFSSSNLPVIMCYFNHHIDRLEHVRFPSKILYLDIMIEDLKNPSACGWENYDTIFAMFPNLKGICLTVKQQSSKWLDLNKALGSVDEENIALAFAKEEIQQIWTERISYLESQGVELLTEQNYMAIQKKLLKQFKWGFHFFGITNKFAPRSFLLKS